MAWESAAIDSIEGKKSAFASLPVDFWSPVHIPTSTDVAQSSAPLDFWQPPQELVPTTPLPSEATASASVIVDFWGLDSDAAPPQTEPADWGAGISLPWFDRQLGENPFVVNVEPPSALALSVRRGRWLSQLLDIPQPRRRRTFATFFGELFAVFPAKATFQTLADLAAEGVDPEAVLNGCRFKLNFHETSRLASRRQPRVSSPIIGDANMLSWRRAVGLAEICEGDDPADHIGDDWYEDWLSVESGDALFWTYLDFLEWRLRSARLGYLSYHRSSDNASNLDIREMFGARQLGSRTGRLVRSQDDSIGVLYPEPTLLYLNSRRMRE